METGVVYAFVDQSYKSVMIEYSKNRYKITTDNNTIDDSFDPTNIESIVFPNKRKLISYIKTYNTTLIKDNINTVINSINKFKKAVIKTE